MKGDNYRMFSSGFLHVDYNHLFFNLFTLFVFSSSILNQLGEIYYLGIYIVSLYFYSAVGASGAVSGIVYSSILLFPEMKLVFIFFPIPLPSYVFGIGYILYSIYGMKKDNDNIGHTAHLGGAIAGTLITILIEPSIIVNQTWLVVLLIFPFLFLYKRK
jgi:membrane associated rhomboid family serine protease